jgi:hypothetical protein
VNRVPIEQGTMSRSLDRVSVKGEKFGKGKPATEGLKAADELEVEFQPAPPGSSKMPPR